MDGRLARGAETRRATLARAVDIASVEGLDGLTLGRLAGELRLSKSGIFAHFGSKEDLQLAAITFAEDVFAERVLKPSFQAPRGRPRLLALLDHWMEYSRSRVFPGGCFFSAITAEFDAREGRVHDLLVRRNQAWVDLLKRLVQDAVEEKHLPAETDVDQLVFEINAFGRAANFESVLTGTDLPYDRATTAVRARLNAN
ncbi:TetR/AcrR family transcriptional regulator [Actinokineospora sp. NBRC 105648]|uniref:TetR/AcrR family transcriptional regulator n=1 Tax=Actinokineospora sp. NBRC 105648 TaxID=3032206 RepID=UPI0024A28169|nr:TetR/AcrR family transcriptional regulator [Actinokineospora sp. NBRC 105648]GLZ41759.1 TetR family transcriptional regulator [Actinokineospora sp. NBRC 105648]